MLVWILRSDIWHNNDNDDDDDNDNDDDDDDNDDDDDDDNDDDDDDDDNIERTYLQQGTKLYSTAYNYDYHRY